MNALRFLTRKNLAQAVAEGVRRRAILTRKKWRDRITPLGAKKLSQRGPVHPALGIFGVLKSHGPWASAVNAGRAWSGKEQGGKGMAPHK
jgi:hypothetical protein